MFPIFAETISESAPVLTGVVIGLVIPGFVWLAIWAIRKDAASRKELLDTLLSEDRQIVKVHCKGCGQTYFIPKKAEGCSDCRSWWAKERMGEEDGRYGAGTDG